MNTYKYRSVAAIVLSFALVFSFLSTSFAQETRIVRLHGGTSYSTNSIRIEPATLQISKGGVVVWNNWAKTSEVKIIFEEGKICQDVTAAPMGFTLDAKQCFVTTWTPLGGTSSLRFTQAGKYRYVVEASGGVRSKGTIHVY